MNRNLKFAIGQFVVFLAGAALCQLVAMPLVTGILLLAALVAAHGIFQALPRKPGPETPKATSGKTSALMYEPEDITRDFLIRNDGKPAGIRWDCLSMRSYVPDTDVRMNALLDRVVEVKTAAEDDGIAFTG